MKRSLEYENFMNKMDIKKWSLAASGVVFSFLAIRRFRLYLENNSFERLIMSESGDSQLIRKYCDYIEVNGLNNSKFRVRYINIPHPKAQQMPKDLPVVLFLHGLGGQLNQLNALIDYFSRISHVVALDFPGCGKSYQEEKCSDYTSLTLSTHGLITIIRNFIGSILNKDQPILLVGYSMGVTLAADLAALPEFKDRIIGLSGICPPDIGPLDDNILFKQKVLKWIPVPVFNAFRWYDRKGGLTSTSVTRMTCQGASGQAKIAQLRCNLDVKTLPWISMASSFVPTTKDEWISIRCPVFLIGAQDDQVASPLNVTYITELLEARNGKTIQSFHIVSNAGHSVVLEEPETICELIGNFIKTNIDERLSLSWQINYLDENKDKNQDKVSSSSQ